MDSISEKSIATWLDSLTRFGYMATCSLIKDMVSQNWRRFFAKDPFMLDDNVAWNAALMVL